MQILLNYKYIDTYASGGVSSGFNNRSEIKGLVKLEVNQRWPMTEYDRTGSLMSP